MHALVDIMTLCARSDTPLLPAHLAEWSEWCLLGSLSLVTMLAGTGAIKTYSANPR